MAKTYRGIMEEHIKRKLGSKEIIHHKNGNKLDNRIKNLEITNQIDHAKIHYKRGDYRSIKKHRWGKFHHPPQTKISKKEVLEIRYLRSFGWPLYAIADAYELYYWHVCKICLGTYWKYVSQPTAMPRTDTVR